MNLERTKFAMKDFSKHDDRPDSGGDIEYNFNKDKIVLGNFTGKTIYEDTLWLEQNRAFSPLTVTLRSIELEIKNRIIITKNEIFTIGELLCFAKKKCSVEKKSFQKWIEETFDFSYETANNFMNVFKYSLGFKNIALLIPTTILYKISKPNIANELREYLFKKGNLETMSNGKFDDIIQKFNEKGIDGIEKEIDQVSNEHYTKRQMAYTLDTIEHALRVLDDMREKIITRGNIDTTLLCIPREEILDSYTPTASQVNKILYDALQDCYNSLNKAFKEAQKIASVNIIYL